MPHKRNSARATPYEQKVLRGISETMPKASMTAISQWFAKTYWFGWWNGSVHKLSPALIMLERRGLISSIWDSGEPPRKRFYFLTGTGRQALPAPETEATTAAVAT